MEADRNTPENKAKFFALYWGQVVVSDTMNDGGRNLYPVQGSEMYSIHRTYLELKPLSQITDKDLKELNASRYEWRTLYEDTAEEDLTAQAFDILRSKGYALPWMGISVEQQIEWGWVKLKD